MLAGLVARHKIKLAIWHINFSEVDLHAKDDNGISAIIHAADLGYYELVELLLAKGVSATDTTTFKTSPLHKACTRGHIDIAKLLIKHGADILTKDLEGFDALVLAAHNGHAEMVDYLLSIGADPHYQITKTNQIFGGFTPLMMAVSTESASLEIVQQLITRGVDINHQSAIGSTALQMAVVWSQKPIIELLLQHGADPNLKNRSGSSALITASVIHKPEIMDLLIQYGANLSDQNKFGRTALMQSAVYQKGRAGWITVNQLLFAGADPNIRDTQGKKAIENTKCPSVKEVFERWPLTVPLILLNELKIDYCVDYDFWADIMEFSREVI